MKLQKQEDGLPFIAETAWQICWVKAETAMLRSTKDATVCLETLPY